MVQNELRDLGSDRRATFLSREGNLSFLKQDLIKKLSPAEKKTPEPVPTPVGGPARLYGVLISKIVPAEFPPRTQNSEPKTICSK